MYPTEPSAAQCAELQSIKFNTIQWKNVVYLQ